RVADTAGGPGRGGVILVRCRSCRTGGPKVPARSGNTSFEDPHQRSLIAGRESGTVVGAGNRHRRRRGNGWDRGRNRWLGRRRRRPGVVDGTGALAPVPAHGAARLGPSELP